MFDSEGGPSCIDDPLGLRIKNERLVRLTGVLAIALRPTDLRKRLQIAP